MRITLWINDRQQELEVTCNEFLAETLRNNGYLSVRQGCSTTSCGLCTVWMDDKPVLSCSVLSVMANGKRITTIEGVQDEARAVAGFLVGEGAEQCGFCIPGLVMTVLAMKKDLRQPTAEQIVHYLNGNLCRCSGYMGQLRGIKKYLGVE